MQVELLDFAKELLGYYGLLAIVIIYFFYNLPRFFDSISYLNSRKIKSLEEALKSSYLSEFDESVIKDTLSNYYLKKAANLSINKRDKIDYLYLYNELSERFTLLEIEKAFQIISVSALHFNLYELEREHLRLLTESKKIYSKLMIIAVFVYAIFIILSLYFFMTTYEKYPGFNILGSTPVATLIQGLAMSSTCIVIFDSTVKALKRMKKIDTAIGVIVFLRSRLPPHT